MLHIGLELGSSTNGVCLQHNWFFYKRVINMPSTTSIKTHTQTIYRRNITSYNKITVAFVSRTVCIAPCSSGVNCEVQLKVFPTSVVFPHSSSSITELFLSQYIHQEFLQHYRRAQLHDMKYIASPSIGVFSVPYVRTETMSLNH